MKNHTEMTKEAGNSWMDIYKRRMAEAGAEDAVYSSSPELTILEYITAASAKQLWRIQNPDFNIEEALIQLAGFYRRKRSHMSIWLQVCGEHEGFMLPARQRFKVGNVCFENERTREICKGRLLGVYVSDKKEIKNFSQIAIGAEKNQWELFGKTPKAGICIYLVFDQLPALERQLSLYVQCKENPGSAGAFRWELLGKNGGREINSSDYTKGFNKSGELSFDIGGGFFEAVKLDFMEDYGYVIRGTLTGCEEGSFPMVSSIRGPVFPLAQKETKAAFFTFYGEENCYIYSDIIEEQYIKIYVKGEGEKAYRLCKGGCIEKSRQDFGQYCYSFKFSYEKAVISAYSQAAAESFEIGSIYGYDNEELSLPFKNIIRDSFSVILEIGGGLYDIVKPNQAGFGGFLYELEESEGKLKILNSGKCSGAKIYIGELAVYSGSEGILSEGTEVEPVGYDTDIKFVCAADSAYGEKDESFPELRERFIKDVYQSYTAVTAEDYEKIVKSVPAVKADAVKAWADHEKNQVNIAVYIRGMEKGQRLASFAKRAIMQELDKHRLISTKIALISPVFVRVNVSVSVIIGKHYEGCEERIRSRIKNSIDYISMGRGFGEPLLFEEVYREIEREEGVEGITSLSIAPESFGHVLTEGLNIRPDNESLLTAGRIWLTIDYEGRYREV